MFIHMLKKLFSKKYRRELRLRKQAQIELEFEQLFLKLSDMFFKREGCDPYIDLLLGGYEIDGSWLDDSFYLDIHKKDKKLGRIYISHNLFMDRPPIRWSAITASPNNEHVFEAYSYELITNDLAHAINSIVPKLVLTWFHEGKRMMSVDIEIPDLSSIMQPRL